MYLLEIFCYSTLIISWGIYWLSISKPSWLNRAKFLLIISWLSLSLLLSLKLDYSQVNSSLLLNWALVLAIALLIMSLLLFRLKLSSIGLVLPIAVLGLVFLNNYINQTYLSWLHELFSYKNVAIIHISLMLISYILLLLSLLFNLFYIYKNISLKRYKRPISNSIVAIESLLKLNYISLLASFIFLSLGILSGVLVASIVKSDQGDIIRLLSPIILWSAMAGLIVYSHLMGIRGQLISKATLLIFILAIMVLIYEFYSLELLLN